MCRTIAYGLTPQIEVPMMNGFPENFSFLLFVQITPFLA